MSSITDASRGIGEAGAPWAIEVVKKILLEEISLAKPDDLAFLESQVSRIAGRIVDRIIQLDRGSES
jgi:uncharacterized protein (DUF111 family)